MPATVTIGGEAVSLAWTQEIARRYAFRCSQIGGGPRLADFSHAKKAAAAVTSFLWLILPGPVHARYPSPEELFVALEETDPAEIHAAVMAVLADMNPPAEKKSTSQSSPSPASSSA